MPEFKEIFNKIDQIGVVVKDLEKVKAGMRDLFGVEPLNSSGVFNYKNATVKGKIGNCSMHVLFYDFFGLQIEFIKPLSGDSIWQDFIHAGREGLHHIRFDVPSHEGAKQVMAEKGVEVYHEGNSVRGGGVKYTYFNTVPKVGFILETLNLREVTNSK